MTAKELVNRLAQNADYVAKVEERERRRQATVRKNQRDSADLMAELTAAGFPVDWISDLYRLRYDYRPAIPILIKWLNRLDNIDVKDSIVRALTDKWARPVAARPLVEEFKRASMEDTPPALNYKWAIGNALSVVADDSVFDDVRDLVRDSRHKWSREMLCLALGKMKNPEVDALLIGVLDQDQGDADETAGMTRAAIRALGNRKSTVAKQRIEGVLSHPVEFVRKEAAKSLRKIEGAEDKQRTRRGSMEE